jgi:hypothetical protein
MEVSAFILLVLNHSVVLLVAYERNTNACFSFLLINLLLLCNNNLVHFVSLSYHHHLSHRGTGTMQRSTFWERAFGTGTRERNRSHSVKTASKTSFPFPVRRSSIRRSGKTSDYDHHYSLECCIAVK